MAIRSRFPILESKIYFNSCSYGALSVDVRDACLRYLDEWNERGSDWVHWMGLYEELRALFARLINARPEEIAVISCVSAGVNALASALDFGGRRHKVIVSDFEFPTVGEIWHAQRSRGARVIHVRENAGGRIPLERYARAIDDETLLVSIAEVCHRHGSRQDVRAIAELAHARGALVLLDAYQSIGTRPIDVEALGADFMVAGTLKYLLSSAGTAMLYVRRELVEQLRPTHSGWFAQADIEAMDIYANTPAPTARRFESGTPPVPNIYAALAGVGLVLDYGLERVAEEIGVLTEALICGIAEQGWRLATDPQAHGAMIAVRSTDERALVEALAAQGIVTSCRDGNLRISAHLYNDLSDVDRVLASLHEHRGLLLR